MELLHRIEQLQLYFDSSSVEYSRLKLRLLLSIFYYCQTKRRMSARGGKRYGQIQLILVSASA